MEHWANLSSDEKSNEQNKDPKKSTAYSRSRKKNASSLDWLQPPYNHVRGENSLWIAVITQAMMDALSKSRNPETQYHRHESIRWLTGNSKDFIMVCHFADMDPDYVRRKAKKAIIAPTPWRAEAGKGKRYLERRTYRQKNKKPAVKEPAPAKPAIIIQGPWVI